MPQPARGLEYAAGAGDPRDHPERQRGSGQRFKRAGAACVTSVAPPCPAAVARA
ncbi:hypothetical protein [Oceanicola sp. D3]|uniref:hypothetical protein n=1 Tax=Oceanicola sp. D3 TaxID=2587163 RepID=UPI00143DBBCC|nr:hypothetical protein [Oceanicola sp. D3]